MRLALSQPNDLALLGRACAPVSKKKKIIFGLFGAMAPVSAPWGGHSVHCPLADMVAMGVLRGFYSVRLPSTPRLASTTIVTDEDIVRG
jgi:hypothetical protein